MASMSSCAGDTTITNLEKHLKTHSSDSSLSSCLLESCFTGPAQQAEPSQVLEELAPAWHPPAGFDGFKTKTARAAVARLRGLVVLGRSAVESLPPAGVLKVRGGIFGVVACSKASRLAGSASHQFVSTARNPGPRRCALDA